MFPLSCEVSEDLPDDFTRGDSAYDSVLVALQPELRKPFRQLSLTNLTQSSELGSGETGESSGSAEESLPMRPQTGVDGGDEPKGATDREQRTPLTPTHGKVWKERRG